MIQVFNSKGLHNGSVNAIHWVCLLKQHLCLWGLKCIPTAELLSNKAANNSNELQQWTQACDCDVQCSSQFTNSNEADGI